MPKDVDDFVSKCKTYLKYSRSVQKEPLLQTKRPEAPLKVAVAIMAYGGRAYLIVMDYYSCWIQLIPLSYKNASEIINNLKNSFFYTWNIKNFHVRQHAIPKQKI